MLFSRWNFCLVAAFASTSLALPAVTPHFNILSIACLINDKTNWGFDQIAIEIRDPITKTEATCWVNFNSSSPNSSGESPKSISGQPPSEWVSLVLPSSCTAGY
jgi:hypothetical protein